MIERLVFRLRGTASGYVMAALLSWSPVFAQQPPRSVSVTFDDLPASGAVAFACNPDAARALTSTLLAHLSEHSVPAVGFVNEGRPCPDLVEEILELWLDAGMELGNHTATHPDLNNVSADVYRQDILAGELITRRLLDERARPLRYFRFPYLHAGNTTEKKENIEFFLASRGYTIAPVTIDSDEWLFARAYAVATRRGDSTAMQAIEDEYLVWIEAVVAHFEGWSLDVLGYELPQVLLLHANQLNAATFGDVADMFKRRGYRFVSLEQALEDPAYREPDPYVGRYGNSWLHRWARGRGMEVRWEPDAPDWIVEFGD